MRKYFDSACKNTPATPPPRVPYSLNNLYDELHAQITAVAACTALPRIKTLLLPGSHHKSEDKYAKFGLLVLEDNSAGFFYRLLDLPQWSELEKTGRLRQLVEDLIGEDPADAAALVTAEDPISRSIGIAAINAISQHVYRSARWAPPDASPAGLPPLTPTFHMGMVGYFGPIVERLKNRGVKLTVLELDESLFQTSDRLVVTGDATLLSDCDHVMCTASTLLNNTLDSLLTTIGPKPYFELVGPTCGCFADALFKRGVNRIGGSRVSDVTAASARISTLEPWGNAVRKYVITPDDYPGLENLLSSLAD